MLRALREFLNCKGVVVNSKSLDTGEKAKAWLIMRNTANFMVFAFDQNIFLSIFFVPL